MRRAFFTAIVALVVSASVLPATAESAGGTRVRYYEGPTSDGGRLSIGVRVSDGVARLSLLLIDGPYTCEDGTEGQIATGVGWGGNGGPVFTDQHLELSENWQVIAFMVSGRLGAHRGSGTVTFLLPGLTVDEQAQVCTMGATWAVERTAGEDLPFRPAVVQRAGGRTITAGLGVRGSAGTTELARAENRQIRHYRGRTSLGSSMAAQTRRVDAGIELLALSIGYEFGFELACDDGTEFGLGYRAIIDSPTVMPPGRFDLDWRKVSPAEALHLHGELDAHSGSGTLALIWPILTEDLQAQLCKSGEQTWELWRTDAGY